jgi:hypothetical protein
MIERRELKEFKDDLDDKCSSGIKVVNAMDKLNE